MTLWRQKIWYLHIRWFFVEKKHNEPFPLPLVFPDFHWPPGAICVKQRQLAALVLFESFHHFCQIKVNFQAIHKENLYKPGHTWLHEFNVADIDQDQKHNIKRSNNKII